MNQFDLFIFDLGRVLIDFDFNIALSKLDRFAPIDRGKVHSLFMNSQLSRDWDKGLLMSEEFYKIVRRELQLPLEMEQFIPIWNDIFTPKPEMIEAALELAMMCPTYLLSNTNPWHSQYLKRNFNWLNQFKELVASCEVKMLKPDREIYEHVLKKAGVSPQKTLYVDDIEENVASAKSLGMDAIQFKSHPLFLEELKSRKIV